MRELQVATAQFEARDADFSHNLERVRQLSRRAARAGASLVCFHECCLSGYSFVQPFRRDQLLELAQPVPDGPATQTLRDIAREEGLAIGAGLFERDGEAIHNTYLVVTPTGRVEKFRKLHAFVNPHLTPGDRHLVFEFEGWQVGILICYDNNLPENVRITAMMGAEIILMPHVTCGLPSVMPGRGTIDPELWRRRDVDPVPLRREFRGPKGREWLLRWLPTRAYENGVYAIFANAVGVDHDTIKTGNSMVLDPYGEILQECHALGDDVVVATLTADKLEMSSGRRYLRARRPELYGKLVEPLPPGTSTRTEPGWKLDLPPDA